MRRPFAALIFLPAVALAAPDFVSDFQPAALQESPAQGNETLVENAPLELLKRQNGCASGYSACNNINQPGLCCRLDQVCSADAAGHPACCPQGAACTGTINPVNTGGFATGTFTSSSPFVTASTTGTGTTGSSFIQASTTPNAQPRSTVSNQFYPFAFIPTTYTNAAACSSAYTSCQSDAASCTAALASGQNGVTISAPNGGVTITAVPSLGAESASSICSSLSSQACYNLNVQACARFGDGPGSGAAEMACAHVYRVGAGVALGIAGQMLR